MRNQIKKVAIIGGGWSGLYALKYALAEGFDAELFEKSDRIGGVWAYRENASGGVWASAHATSSKTFLHASDFPLPEEYPLFPHHTHIYQYLCDYVNHFGLLPHIKLNHSVQAIEKIGSRWSVSVVDQINEANLNDTFDAVFLCAGQNTIPSWPSEAMYQRFKGCTLHSFDYKYPTENLYGKKILIVGGGESASDIANELSRHAKHVYMSVRRGLWYFTRHNGVSLPSDTRFSRRSRWIANDYGNNIIVRLVQLMTSLNFGVGGHGIAAWKPNYSLLGGIINKSNRVLEKIPLGLVTPKGEIVSVQEQSVLFKGDTEPTEIDIIVYATGYQQKIPFDIVNDSSELYKHLFYVDDPTLMVLGYVRPVFGSIVGLAELQARWATAVLAGKVDLPAKDKMKKIIWLDQIKHKKNFPEDHEKRPHLVSHFAYADYIAKQLKARPSLFRMFFSDFRKWKLLMWAPWTPFEILVNNPSTKNDAYTLIEKAYLERRAVKEPSLFTFLSYIVIISTIVMFMALLLSSYSLWLMLS